MNKRIETRISGLLTIGDGLCLLILGRYWAWDLSFLAKQARKSAENHYKGKEV